MDPRYAPDAIKHDLASVGLFARIVTQYVEKDGYTDDADFVAEYRYNSHKRTQVEWVYMNELVAVQPYWCEGNINRLQQLDPSKREMPVVFRYRGVDYLMDGTHRCLLHLMETKTTLIEVRVVTVK